MVDGNIILSVAKAMELLQALSRAEKPLTLAELTECSGYPKSTVFGLLTTMRAYDVITQTPEGKYALGLRLFEYGRQVERKWDISRVARPYMEHLSQRTGASVMLSICEGGSVITLDQVEARDKLRIVSDAGARLPIYCTSQGKVFLAHMPRAQAEKLLRRQSMTQFTPHTITDVSALLQEVDACRTNGFAIENGEYKIGLRSISAPVYTVDRTVRYTVGVIGMFRSTHSDEFRSAVEQVCAEGAVFVLMYVTRGSTYTCPPPLFPTVRSSRFSRMFTAGRAAAPLFGMIGISSGVKKTSPAGCLPRRDVVQYPPSSVRRHL